MKKANAIKWMASIAVAVGMTLVTASAHAAPPPFYEDLAYHGNWMVWQGGVHVWQPAVAVGMPDWRPYYHDGHWVWNGTAWQWQSSYAWGSIVFHYGRWWLAPSVGWVWVPDTVYSPAWVQWRYTGNVWGWAPMPPPSYMHTQLAYGYSAYTGYSFSAGFYLMPSHYVFVPMASFGTVYPSGVVYCGSSSYVHFSATRTVACGPSPYTVVHASHVTVSSGTPVSSPAPAPTTTTTVSRRMTAVSGAVRSTSSASTHNSATRHVTRTANTTVSGGAPSGSFTAARSVRVDAVNRSAQTMPPAQRSVSMSRSHNASVNRFSSPTIAQAPAVNRVAPSTPRVTASYQAARSGFTGSISSAVQQAHQSAPEQAAAGVAASVSRPSGAVVSAGRRR